MTSTTIEERLSALEQAFATMERQLKTSASSDNWLAKFTGSITDEEAFREALEYGRAFRNSDRPAENSGEQP